MTSNMSKTKSVFLFFGACITIAVLVFILHWNFTQNRLMRDVAMYGQGYSAAKTACSKKTRTPPDGAIEGVYFVEPANTGNQ